MPIISGLKEAKNILREFDVSVCMFIFLCGALTLFVQRSRAVPS